MNTLTVKAPAPRVASRHQRVRRRLGHQPALDGLRGVAVIAVMLFHDGVSWLPGGFLGVDLFFVLSGFLITTLLLEEWGVKARIDLRQFWARRARRLFPALALVLAAIAVYGATAAPPATRSSLRGDGLSALLYVANWRFIVAHQPYFAAFAVPSPLRHLWSLAVEEQWYVLWPPTLMVLVTRLRRRWAASRSLEILIGVLVALALASLAQMVRLDLITHGAADSTRSYYGTDTHIQVLLVGAVLAVARLRWPPDPAVASRGLRWAGWAGAVVCGLMFVAAAGSQRWLYRGGFALFALAAAAVIAAGAAPVPGALSRALSKAPLTAIGRVSYGLYLWHWPVDIYLNPTRAHLGGVALIAARTVATAALAMASYHLVEMPIRTRRALTHGARPVTGATFAVLALALTVLPGIGATATTPAAGAATTQTIPPTTLASTVIPAVPPGVPLKVLVVGDSVGQSLTRRVTPPAPLVLSDASLEGCGVTFGAAIVGGFPLYDVSQCPESKQQAAWLAGLAAKPQVVVMSFGTWEVFDQEFDGHAYKVYGDDYAQLLRQQLQADVDFLARYDNPRVVLLDVPCYQEARYSLGGSASPRDDPRRVAWVNTVFAQVARANPGRVTLVPISQWACPGGQFLTRRDGVVLRADGVHYDPRSAALTWKWLAPQIQALTQTDTTVPVTTP